ncbi:MAG: zinc dependent phospholipase C family protein [Thomasclavelia sp.]|nr:zinc dependent phospholipase C family protein [Thomasclavelia sp.]
MPASYTHYNFCKDVLDKMPEGKIKDLINGNIDYYYLGTHGPDIFFFHYPIFPNKTRKLGHDLHHQKAIRFFTNARYNIHNPQQLVYIIGFICHYALDSIEHPYVGRIIKDSGVKHFEIESEYDRRLMVKNKENPLKRPLVAHLKHSQEIVTNLQPFFPTASCKQIDDSIRLMKYYDRLLVAPNVMKRGAIYFVFSLTFHFRTLQGLVMNYRPNKKLEPYFKEFDTKYLQSIDLALELINDFVEKYPTDKELSVKFNHNYY